MKKNLLIATMTLFGFGAFAQGTLQLSTPKPTVKAPVKKKVLVMPDTINPFKMTPAQKAEYLKNAKRYDK